MIRILAVMLILITCPIKGFSADNYLQLRYDFSSDYKENVFILFENNSLENWALNARLVSINEDFRIFLPSLYYKFGNGFQFGARVNLDSFDGKHLGPVFRYKKPIRRFLVMFDSTFLKSLNSDDDKFDAWLYVSTRVGKTSWRCGAELRYFGTVDSSKYFQIRPARVTYDFNKNFSAFIMPQRQWSDSGETTDLIMGGIEFRF